VLAVDAAGIAAGYEKERGRAVDNDVPRMSISSHARPVLNVELEADKARHLILKPRRVILTPAPLCEPLRLHAVLTGVHQHGDNVTTLYCLRCRLPSTVLFALPLPEKRAKKARWSDRLGRRSCASHCIDRTCERRWRVSYFCSRQPRGAVSRPDSRMRRRPSGRLVREGSMT
jgi:hypothetical protein